MAIIQNDLDKLLIKWSVKKTSNGKSVDELLTIDEMPLSWFYRRLFAAHVIPKPLNTFSQLKKGRKLSIYQKIRLSVNSKVLQKYILLNEKRKIDYLQKEKVDCSKNPKILFLSYTNHISAVESIFRIQNMVNQLKEKKGIEELVLFVDPLSSTNYKKLQKRRTLYNYYSKELEQRAKKKAKELFHAWNKLTENEKHRLLSTGGLSFWPYLKYSFSLFYSEEFIYLTCLYYEMAQLVLTNENIKGIVVTSQGGFFEKCFLAAAKKKNIPVFQVQHGMGAGILDVSYPAKRFVFSEYHKKELLGAGVAEKDIFVTGPIIFDDIFAYLNVPQKKEPTVIFATSPAVEDNLCSKKFYFGRIKQLLSELKKIDNLEVIIKLHPRERHQKEYQKIVEIIGIKARIIKDLPINEFYRLIREAHLFMSFGSTAGLEAMILDKPIVTIDLIDSRKNLDKKTYCFTILENDVGVNVPFQEDLVSPVRKALENESFWQKKRKEFVEQYVSKIDGKASERALALIYETIGSLKL